MTSIADLLANAGGTPSAFTKDSPIGTTVQGQIVDAQVRQTRNYETGDPEYWSDGNPKVQVAIILQTNLRDPMTPDDDGRRGVYVKWWGDSRTALAAAIKAAGDTDIRVGGLFMAKYVGEKPNDNPRLNATKIYQYAYQMPAQTAGLDLAGEQVNTGTGEVTPAPAPAPAPAPQPAAPLMGTTDAAQAALQQQLGAQVISQAPAPAPQPAAAAAPQVDTAKVRQLLGLGLSDAEVAGATGASLEVIAAIRNLP